MPPGLDELIEQVEALMAYITQNGASLNTETQQALGAFLQETMGFIEEYSQSRTQPTPTSTPEEPTQPTQGTNPISPTTGTGEGEPPTHENPPELEQAPHPSSNINAFRYNPSNGQLFVKFQGKYPANDGPVYAYEGVPKNIFEIFRRGAVAPRTSGSNAWHTWKEGTTPSHGAAMYALIREGNYRYRRLS